jgi:ABC-type branched-subunit amino acid transport system substrate-binding protein
MAISRLKIGLSLRFDMAAAPHMRSFFRTLALAINHIQPVSAMDFMFADDCGTAEGAIKVANGFVAAGVDLVLGHFSSDSALAAIDIYADNRTPLLLPAATATGLTVGATHVLRLCPPDSLLADRLIAHVVSQNWSAIELSHEPSSHGELLSREITLAAWRHGVAVLSDGDSGCAPVSIFAGAVNASNLHVRHLRDVGDVRPVILTDDAASPALAQALHDIDHVSVVGFAPASMQLHGGSFTELYRRTYGVEPGVNAFESMAALEIASKFDQFDAMSTALQDRLSFQTSMGNITFSNGQKQTTPHALWNLSAGRLVIDKLLDQ